MSNRWRIIAIAWVAAWVADTAQAADLTLNIILAWDDPVSGSRGGLDTAAFPQIVLRSDRVIISTDPAMAPSVIRERLADCGKTAKTPEAFMRCRQGAGIIVAPDHNAAVFLPRAGGPLKCSSNQVLSGKSYRLCASYTPTDPSHFDLSYVLEADNGGTVIKQRADVSVELLRDKCNVALKKAERNYANAPGRMIGYTKARDEICNYRS